MRDPEVQRVQAPSGSEAGLCPVLAVPSGVTGQALSHRASRVPTAPHLLTPFPISRLKISKIQPLLCTWNFNKKQRHFSLSSAVPPSPPRTEGCWWKEWKSGKNLGWTGQPPFISFRCLQSSTFLKTKMGKKLFFLLTEGWDRGVLKTDQCNFFHRSICTSVK